MSYLNRVWMAATVAVAQGHPADHGHNCKFGLNSVHHNRRRLFSAGDSSDLRSLSGKMSNDVAGVISKCDVEDTRNQADDSLRKVMYLNCWGQGWSKVAGDIFPDPVTRVGSTHSKRMDPCLGSSRFLLTLTTNNWKQQNYLGFMYLVLLPTERKCDSWSMITYHWTFNLYLSFSCSILFYSPHGVCSQ